MKKYKVNEIFYSLQGEGYNAGRAALFVRFSGCNLRCPFCDTDFASYEELTGEEIVRRMNARLPRGMATHDADGPSGGLGRRGAWAGWPPMVVLTGGEPSLQADAPLLELIHNHFSPYIAMESNGTHEPPRGLDWLTVSPKGRPKVSRCDELKAIFDGETPVSDYGVEARHYFLQPMDTGDAARNATIVSDCVDYIKAHPKWRLSLQTHKLIGIR